MTLLALDTSARTSVALIDGGGQIYAERSNDDPRGHAESLAPLVGELVALVPPERLTALVVGVGPGPFTGLRAGIVTARALSAVWSLPLHGVMSLDALAYEVLAETAPASEFVVATDARRQEVYWARYAAQGARLEGPRMDPPQALPCLPAYGAGAGRYPEVFAERCVPGYESSSPRAAFLGQYAYAHLQRGQPLLASTPVYVRPADARVPGPRKRALPGRGR